MTDQLFEIDDEAATVDVSVHPIAALFPMLSPEELQALADDIAERGQLQPITLDSEGQIIDGRNRYAACKLAGVEPWYETYEGEDAAGYALASNINRRHLTKGQQAAIVAKAVFETNTVMSRDERHKLSNTFGISETRIAYANVVLQADPEALDEVIANTKFLDAEYQRIQADRAERERQAAIAARQAAQMRQYDDLTEEVEAGKLPVADAIKIALDRQQKEEQRQKDLREQFTHSSTMLSEAVSYATQILKTPESRKRTAQSYYSELNQDAFDVTLDSIKQAAQNFSDLAKVWVEARKELSDGSYAP